MADTTHPAVMDLSHLLSPPDHSTLHSFSSRRRSSTPRASFASCTASPSSASLPASPPSTIVVTKPRSIDDGLTLPPFLDVQSQDIMAKLPSPPITPATRLLLHEANPQSDPTRQNVVVVDKDAAAAAAEDAPMEDADSVLFPSDAGTVYTASTQPLFPVDEPAVGVDPAIEAVVNQHMAMQMTRFQNSVSRPTRDEYLLAASCVPIVSKKYAKNPRAWLEQERRILDERFGKASRVWKRPLAPKPAKLDQAPAAAAGKKASGKAGGKANGKPTAASKTRAPRAAGGRAPRATKRTPSAKVLDAFDANVAPAAKRVIGTSRDDTDFAALPDYSPPTSTLPANNAKALKADWKGQMLDLSQDPNRGLLHEAELNLAATLRLSCATYLCSKRRIFMGRLEALRIGKEFRKTDSQQACKIDVNKASKLWAAYEKVGWFKPAHFVQYL